MKKTLYLLRVSKARDPDDIAPLDWKEGQYLRYYHANYCHTFENIVDIRDATLFTTAESALELGRRFCPRDVILEIVPFKELVPRHTKTK